MMISTGTVRREAALSEVIGFVLLLAIIVTAISFWMTYYVPATGRELEISQMNVVRDRITDYKISLDSLWTNNQTGVTLSTTINLGTPGGNSQSSGPFLFISPAASTGTLTIQDPGDKLFINSSTGTADAVINMGTVEYQSNNNYWIQKKFVYETGGLFLVQNTGSTCLLSPPYSLVRANNGTADVAYVNLVPIRILGGGSVSGSGPVRVDSLLQATNQRATLQPNTWVNLSVNVADKQTALMWLAMANETRVRGNLTDSTWYSFGVYEDPVSKRGTAFMLIKGPYAPPSPNPDVYLSLRTVDYVVTLNNIVSVTGS